MDKIKILLQIITLLVMIYILVLIFKIDDSREKRLDSIDESLTIIADQLQIDIIEIN